MKVHHVSFHICLGGHASREVAVERDSAFGRNVDRRVHSASEFLVKD